ncbi:hypothetical protein SSP35_14_01330 [Streptomyces sp. NBRC 110611]|uniref:hypothetical protein n=1 Tax=Streptomyces sp. NBRC 110611 TaxID=1621259 RepID=UPI000836FB6A|nr:hypothetical protein [Streptomyces sp. NBRC 110611]GAU69799.1 hypothetical protein SSP35_14_01330 [Streptomyces sp. NBRC 110611]
MAGFREFLMRFRPVGLPGRAASAGVPADRSAELAAELAPPLSLLEQAEAEARGVRERAVRVTEERRRSAEREADEIVERARARAHAVRAETADRIRRAAEAEAAALLASAECEAAAVRRRAEARMPALLERVTALVNEELGEWGAAAAQVPHVHGTPREGGGP